MIMGFNSLCFKTHNLDKCNIQVSWDLPLSLICLAIAWRGRGGLGQKTCLTCQNVTKTLVNSTIRSILITSILRQHHLLFCSVCYCMSTVSRFHHHSDQANEVSDGMNLNVVIFFWKVNIHVFPQLHISW